MSFAVIYQIRSRFSILPEDRKTLRTLSDRNSIFDRVYSTMDEESRKEAVKRANKGLFTRVHRHDTWGF